MWSADGRRIFLPAPENGGGEIRAFTIGLPLAGNWPQIQRSRDVTAVRISHDRRRVILVDERGNITIRNTSTGQVQRTVAVNIDLFSVPESTLADPRRAGVRADGEIIALTGPQTVKIIDVDTGKARDLPGGSAFAVEFTDDHLVIQRSNETVEVWDTNGAGLVRTIPGGSGYERGFAPSSDGELMAQLRTDGTVVITNLSSGDMLGTIQIPDNADSRYAAMVFIPAKHELITATADGKTTRWNLTADAWLQTACETAGRDLTNDEWRRFVGTKPPEKLTCQR